MDLMKELETGRIGRQKPFVLVLQWLVALVVLVGLPLFGACRVFWLLATAAPLLRVTEFLKRIYWNGFDPLIWRATDTGRFSSVVFWNVLTMLLDWLLTALPLSAGAYIMSALVAGTSLPAPIGWFALMLCSYPPTPFVEQSALLTRGIWTRNPSGAALCYMPLGFALASLVLPVAPFHMLMLSILLVPPVLAVRLRTEMPRMRQDYAQRRGERFRGDLPKARLAPWWFPRPGVVFEPQFNPYSVLSAEGFQNVRPMFTILRVHVVGLVLSLALLVGGLVSTCRLGHPLLVLCAVPLVLAGLAYGICAAELDRRNGHGLDLSGPGGAFRGFFTLAAQILVALPVLGFGGHDPLLLCALAALYTGAWFFCVGFVVRATSHAVFDTCELVCTVAGLVLCVAARSAPATCWWEALLPLFVAGSLYRHVRGHWPRRDLRGIPSLLDEEEQCEAHSPVSVPPLQPAPSAPATSRRRLSRRERRTARRK